MYFEIGPLLHPRMERLHRAQLGVDAERQGRALRRVDRICENAKSGRISDNSIKQQRGTFRQLSRDLGDTADFEIGMGAVNMPEKIDFLDLGNEPAQVFVDHRPVLLADIVVLARTDAAPGHQYKIIIGMIYSKYAFGSIARPYRDPSSSASSSQELRGRQRLDPHRRSQPARAVTQQRSRRRGAVTMACDQRLALTSIHTATVRCRSKHDPSCG